MTCRAQFTSPYPAGARAAVASGAVEALLLVVTRIQTAVDAEVAAARHLGSLAPVAAAAVAKNKKMTHNGQLKSKEIADADLAAAEDATAALHTAEREYTSAAEVATEAAKVWPGRNYSYLPFLLLLCLLILLLLFLFLLHFLLLFLLRLLLLLPAPPSPRHVIAYL
jgi:hypothetical protein